MLQVSIKMYRAAKVQTEHLKACAGASNDEHPEKVTRDLMEQFGPLAHGIKIFWPEVAGTTEVSGIAERYFGAFKTTVVGIEVMAFNLEAKFPQAGVAAADPLDQVAINRADGALASELTRWGLCVDPEKFEWRCAYDMKGQQQGGCQV